MSNSAREAFGAKRKRGRNKTTTDSSLLGFGASLSDVSSESAAVFHLLPDEKIEADRLVREFNFFVLLRKEKAMKNQKQTKPTNAKNAKPQRSNAKPTYRASDEFASQADYFNGEAIKEMRRKLQGTTVSITEMERLEFDDGSAWIMHVSEFDKAFKVNASNGRALAEEFGDDILSWAGNQASVTAVQHSVGWGVKMVPLAVADDDDAPEPNEDDDLPFGADDDDSIE